jgi:hypothetical protein
VAVSAPPVVASAAIGPVSRVAVAEDGVVVVAAVVAVAREKAAWVHPPTALSKAAAESASTRSRRSAARDKVIAAASKWPTDTIISTTTVKEVTPVMLMKAMSITGKTNTHTDRATLAASVIRAASATLKRAGPSSPSATRSSHASRVSRVSHASRVSRVSHTSRRKPANRASLVSRANLGKPVSLANHVSHVSPARNNRSRPHVSRSSTTHNSVRARDRQSSRRTTLPRRPLSLSTRVRQSPSLYGPQPRRATDATSNVS